MASTAAAWIAEYYPGPNCRRDRCEHYRIKDSESGPWCWLKDGIGAEGRETECPAFSRATTDRGAKNG
jgi:hypothetical protein